MRGSSKLCVLMAVAAVLLPIASTAKPEKKPLPAGYSIEFNIYDRYVGDDSAPNFEQFAKAAHRWAGKHGLAHPGTPAFLVACPGYQVQVTEGGRGRDGDDIQFKFVDVTLRVEDRTLAEELGRKLALLPGASDPEITRRSPNISVSGITQEMEGMKVIINGIPYAFPNDFTNHEAQQLRWKIGANRGRTHFAAFPNLFNRLPPGSTETPRFHLGDVVRFGVNADGNFTIDTIRQDWDPGDCLYNGWGFDLPQGVDESSIDPVAELAKKCVPPEDMPTRQRYSVGLDYRFIPKVDLVSKGYGSLSPLAKQLIRETGTELDAAIAQWLELHPEFKRDLVWRHRVWGALQGGNTSPNQYHVQISTDSFDEVIAIRDFLRSKVLQVPDPEIHVYDRLLGSKLERSQTPL